MREEEGIKIDVSKILMFDDVVTVLSANQMDENTTSAEKMT